MTSPSHLTVLFGFSICERHRLRHVATKSHSSPWRSQSVDGQVEVVHGRFCSSAPARLELLQIILVAEGESVAHPFVIFTPSATCLAEPRPNITRDGYGSGITGSMAIGVNKANTIWCSAEQGLPSWARMCCLLFSGSTVTAHAYLLSTEDSRVAMTCTWSVMLAV